MRPVPSFSNSLIRFYWVLPDFTEFYRVFLRIAHICGFFYSIVSQLRLSAVCVPSFTGFSWILPSFNGFFMVLPSFSRFHPVSPGFPEFYLVLPSFTEF